MPLIFPTSDILGSLTDSALAKGEIHNLDNVPNSVIQFQFNPEQFEESRPFNWPDTGMRGKPGFDIQYTGEPARTFELKLLWIADPIAPSHNADNTITPVKSEDVSADFDKVVFEIDRWLDPRADLGRPSLLMVIFGQYQVYKGVVTERRKRYVRFFSDLSTRQGELILSFKEWEPVY